MDHQDEFYRLIRQEETDRRNLVDSQEQLGRAQYQYIDKCKSLDAIETNGRKLFTDPDLRDAWRGGYQDLATARGDLRERYDQYDAYVKRHAETWEALERAWEKASVAFT